MPAKQGEIAVATLNEYDTSPSFEGSVLETTRITHEDSREEVRHIVLAIGREDFNFEVGQSVGVLVPPPHELGNYPHLRLYSIAGIDSQLDASTISICVRRCFYIDPVSGEQYKGLASNFLCDVREGGTITLTGPYDSPFTVPDDPAANLIMVGLGTGIAPFRVLLQHIHEKAGSWQGKIRLFYGAKSSLEMLYMNDQNNDLALYYDEKTFKAFQAVSPRPHMGDPIALGHTLEQNREEVWELIQQPNTRVYVAGIDAIAETLDQALADMAGSADAWQERKAAMKAEGRWAELIY